MAVERHNCKAAITRDIRTAATGSGRRKNKSEDQKLKGKKGKKDAWEKPKTQTGRVEEGPEKRRHKRINGLSRRELNPGLERIELMMFKLDKLTY